MIPQALGRTLTQDLHAATHWGKNKLTDFLSKAYYIPGLKQTAQDISEGCPTCQQVNAKQGRRTHPGVCKRGKLPEDHREVDFTKVRPPSNGYKYLLVFVDTFSGWPEAYPTKNCLDCYKISSQWTHTSLRTANCHRVR